MSLLCHSVFPFQSRFDLVLHTGGLCNQGVEGVPRNTQYFQELQIFI